MTLPGYANNQPTFPEMYERWLVGPLFRPWAAALLDSLRVTSGDRVLDIACGTGIVARLALERLGGQGRVVGVDLSAPMLDVARKADARIDWREGNANALPLDGAETFDVVTCQQGLQFIPDRPGAVREMRRALTPGGRVGVATWRPLDEHPFFKAMHQVAERHVGAVVDQRHAYGEAGLLAALLTEAGFKDVQVEVTSRTARFPDGPAFARMNGMALVGMSDASKSMSPEDRMKAAAAIAAESADVLRVFAEGDGGIAFDLVSNVATGRG